MLTLQELFKEREYPGRFIILGLDGDCYVAIYGATGRSESSIARRYVYDQVKQVVSVEVTDQQKFSKGNPDLLLYDAVRFLPNGFLVSNGNHVEKIKECDSAAKDVLDKNLIDVMYENDTYRTPPITGCIVYSSATAALNIIKSDERGGVTRISYDAVLKKGVAQYISTYTGSNIRPTPSYSGDPLEVKLNYSDARSAANECYDSLAPKNSNDDLRVGVVVVYVSRDSLKREIAIINRADPGILTYKI